MSKAKKKNVLVSRIAAVVCILPLTACGYSSQDRVLSGAGIGAAAGAVGGALVGGSVGTGLLLGTAAGAIVGGVTNPHDVNMGKPAWR